MLQNARILVAEDEAFIALDIALAIEEAGGLVIGPTAHVFEALELLRKHDVSGAILDVNLADRDVTPVALFLIDRLVPPVFHTGVGLPSELTARHPNLIVCTKPTSPDRLIRHLHRQMKTA
jgi:AmiR/NasT family two-component response regulator